jgi:ketosteroid isomerase-like protein
MSTEEKNKELMKTLDDAWNSQDWDTFKERHAENVAVFWPGQPNPTRGVGNHHEESVEFFKMFPDNHLVNNPYKIFFANGNYTCSVADFTGTFKGPMKGFDGQMILASILQISQFCLF